MIFTENRYDRSMEQMMKGIPNFHPRGSGIVVTGNFHYTAEMCDCEYCGYYGGKKTGCLLPKCVCLEERISVGVASVKEIMNDTMSEIKHGSFLRRVRRYIKESEAIPMTFINEKHRLNFDEALRRLNRLDRNNYALMAAIYLLTADLRLWFQSKRFVENHGISFGKLRPKNCSEDTYPIYQKFMSDNLHCKSVNAEVETYLYGDGEVFTANEYEVAAFTGRGEKFLHHSDVHLQRMSSFTIYPPVVSLQKVLDKLI